MKVLFHGVGLFRTRLGLELDSTSGGVLSWFCVFERAYAVRLQRAKSKSEQAEVLYFCKVLRYTVWYHHVFVSLLALTRCQPRLGRAPEGSLKPIQSPQTIIVLQAFALALGPALRTTGGAQSATRTTTVRRTPTTSAATRTGASSPRTSRYRPLRGPIPSPPPLLLLPSRLTYGD